MPVNVDAALIAGCIGGGVILGAFLYVPLVRVATLVGATLAFVVGYAQGGVRRIVTFAEAILAQITAEPNFWIGSGCGVLLVALVMTTLRKK